MKKYCTPMLEITYMENKDIVTLSLSANGYNGFDLQDGFWDWGEV